MKRGNVEYTRFDITDAIKNEEYAAIYFKVIVEDIDRVGRIQERLDYAWEDVKRASERHGFSITPELLEAYAEARAAAEKMQVGAGVV